MGIKHSEGRPPSQQYQDLADSDRQILEYANAVGTDRAITLAKNLTRESVRAAGLGRLANAADSTSSFQRGQSGPKAWGAIFARGGDDSLAGGALISYSQGAQIVPVNGGQYVWFQTDVLKRRIKIGNGRYRMTPERYRASGSPLGPLIFRKKSAQIAEYFVKGVAISPKTGLGRIPGARSKAKTGIAVLFVGLLSTVRLKRWDQNYVMGVALDALPGFIEQAARTRRR